MPQGDNNKRYTKSIAENLPAMFANGESIVEVCVEMGISRRAYYDWLAKYPEFKEAAERGKEASEAWWTKLGRFGAAGRAPINAAPWIFNMKNRFGWVDRPADADEETAVPVNITINAIDASVDRE